MFTILIWKNINDIIEDWDDDVSEKILNYFLGVFLSLLSIPLDVFFFPIETIAFIIYKIKEGKKKYEKY